MVTRLQGSYAIQSMRTRRASFRSPDPFKSAGISLSPSRHYGSDWRRHWLATQYELAARQDAVGFLIRPEGLALAATCERVYIQPF